MTKFNFNSKNLIKTFSFTSATQNRQQWIYYKHLGRSYAKYGTVQAVTFVGNLYEDDNHNRILMIGISRQHPNDHQCNKEIGYESAMMKAMTNPDIIMNTVPKFITKYNFNRMCEWYLDGMDLEFIKTSQEKSE